MNTTTTTVARSMSSSSSSSHSDAPVGLFSIPELQKPCDFVKCAQQAMQDCDLLRSSFASFTEHSRASSLSEAHRILFQLDRISQTVCNVIDAAELCRSVHASSAWRDAAHQAFSVLADYIAQLNSDRSLYYALGSVTSQADLVQQLSQEEQRFAFLLQQEFERDGIQLPDVQREEVRRILGHVTELESLFSRNLVHFQRTVSLPAEPVYEIMPESTLQQFGVDTSASAVTLPSEAPLLQSFLKYSSSPQLRQEVYRELYTSVPDNLPVLQALVERRHELAVALGYASYADRYLADKMARNQPAVFQFLNTLLQRTQPYFQQEMSLISKAKQSVEGSSVVEPWDISYYVGLLKQHRGGSDGLDVHSQISPYLTLENCLSGMQLLVNKLFGLEMMEKEMAEEERWDIAGDSSTNGRTKLTSSGNGSTSRSTIRRFSFVEEETGQPLGTMYLDLHPRQGKYGHAAHFTVRCGCQVNDKIMSEQELESEAPPQYQLPIIALVCNLSGGGGNGGGEDSSGHSGDIGNKILLLSHSEVETLFHEFGHALHSLLSRTKFQHLSGTRAAMDFVETPSHLIEQFVWDDQFLRHMARHCQTGEVISDDLLRKLRGSRYEFSALERQNQIIYAMFDQQLFGKPQASNGKVDTTALFAQLNRENKIPYAQGTHWHTQFGHLITYGAGYYGYLYSQVFAGDIWRTLFDGGNSLSRESGSKLWHGLLRHGGAKDPHAMLTDVLGRPPKVDYFLE